jgi:hypothetical protein
LYRAGKHDPTVSRRRHAVSKGRRAGTAAVLSAACAAVVLLAGCGNQYRPVVSSISPVGPAGQPTKYAVSISNPNGADVVTGYSIANNVITVFVDAPNPFLAGQSVSLSGFLTATFLNGQTLTVQATGLSTTQFQASFTHANAAGSEIATATYLGPQQGLITIVDFSGDTILTTPQVQTNPSYFILNTSGTQGYTVNGQGQFDFFGTSNPSSLITSQISQTTLPANSTAVTLSAFTPSSTNPTIFVPQVSTSTVAALNGSAALYDSVSVGANPIYVVGTDGTPRVYALSQGTTPGTSTGSAAAIEVATTNSLAVSSTIPLGINPVYGVMTADDRRAFLLNKGPSILGSTCNPTANPTPNAGTISVINVVNNAPDSTTPAICVPAISVGSGTVPANPIWAGLSPTSSELIVLNQGDGIHPGTLSIVSIPLCNSSATTSNPNCNAANPADATGFGQIVATVPVGVNPVMVSVLSDGSAAYVANAGNATTQGSVTAVNLASGTVEATIPGIVSPATPTAATATYIYGHPTSISATTGSPAGKVYVTAPDSNYVTIIYTDTNTVQNHLTLQGSGVRVLVTAP